MRVLAVGDVHAPCEKDGYLEFCCDMYDAWDCDTVVFVGDVVDLHNASTYDPEPDAPGPKTECDLAAEAIARWYEAFPDAYICEGNHDDRVNRAAKRSNIPRARFIRTYNEAWETPKWEWDFEFELDGVYYFHGDGYSGMHPAFNAARQMAMSVVMGHIHTAAGVKWVANPNQRWFGMDVGSGIDDKKYAFYYSKRQQKKSIISCGVVIDGIPLPRDDAVREVQMNIKINNEWEIKTDPYNFILCRMGRGKRNGAFVSVCKREHYFPTLSQALNFALDKRLQMADVDDWRGVCDIIENFRHDVMQAIQLHGVENVAVKAH